MTTLPPPPLAPALTRKRLASPPSHSHPSIKRSRLIHPTALLNTTPQPEVGSNHRHLSTLLRLLSKDQLSEIITQFVHHTNNAPVHDLLMDLIPKPDVMIVNQYLCNLLNKLHAQFPFTLRPNYNDYEHARVLPILIDIQTTIIDFLDLFCPPTPEPELVHGLQTRIDYLHVASVSTGRLPDWNSVSHNHTKIDLMNRLVHAWKHFISLLYNPAVVLQLDLLEEWGKRLQESNVAVSYQFQAAVSDFDQYRRAAQFNPQSYCPTPTLSSCAMVSAMESMTCSSNKLNAVSAALLKPGTSLDSSLFDFSHLADATSSSASAPTLQTPNRVVFGMGL